MKNKSAPSYLFAIPWCLSFIFGPFLYTQQLIDHYYSTKFLFSSFIFISVACFLIYKKSSFNLPKFPRSYNFLLFLLFSYSIGLIFWLPSELNTLSGIIYFLCIIFCCYQGIVKDRKRFFEFLTTGTLIALSLAIIYSTAQLILTQIYGSRPYHFLNVGYFSVTFGSINIYAQFLALCTPFAFYFIRTTKLQHQILSKLLPLTLLLGLLILIPLTSCRSAILALILVLIANAAFYRYKVTHIIFSLLVIFISFNFLTKQLIPNHETVAQGKSSSSNVRISLMKSGFQMIEKNPLGLGLGQYDYNTFPFRYKGGTNFKPNYNERSPHNEVLKLAIEGGIPLTLLVLSLLVSIFSSLLKKTIKTRTSPEDILILSLILILTTESLTQFPFEMLHPILILGLVFSYSFFRVFKDKIISPNTFSRKVALAVCILALVFQTYYNHNIQKIDYLFGDFSTWTCKNRLADWRRCLQFSKSLRVSHHKQSTAILDSLLYYQPFNAHLLFEKSSQQLAFNQKQEFCQGSNIHSKIYSGLESFPKEALKACKKEVDPKTPIMHSYKNWLSLSKIKIHPSYQKYLPLE